jgi:DNA-binding transcriptional LysR family regulator
MPVRVQRGAAKTQHEQLATPGGFDWDWNDVRVLLSCVRLGSFRKAADQLGLNSTTVMRRIEGFEERLGFPLLNRLHDGVSPTDAGRALVKSCEDMERAFFEVVRKVPQPETQHRGVVRVSITEGLGIYWVMPRLVGFSQQYPNLIVDLRCAMESADVLRMEADLAVQFVRPTAPDLIATKLGRLHVYPFAAKAYIERYGLPKDRADMVNHRLVQQAAPQIDANAWARLLGLESVEGIVGIRSNASSAVFYAVERGAGIGALPTYACALDAPVVPIDIGIHLSFDVWLTYHPDARRTKRTSLVIDWIRTIFDPGRYPWFRDEFIHPNDLLKQLPRDTPTASVGGFFTATPTGD